MKRLIAIAGLALALFVGAIGIGVSSTEAASHASVTVEQETIAKSCYYWQWVYDYRGGVRKVLICTN